MARGLDVEQTAPGGIPTGACQSPGTDFWFVGPGQHSVGRLQLFLLNPASQAADVSVEVFTDAGPLQGSTDTGISVPAGGMVVQSLAGILHGSRVIALHVRTSVGQVVAAMEETTGGAVRGGWLPATRAPATQLVLPGLPGSAGGRELYVAVPGTGDAHLTLTAVTSRGSYHPTGGGGIDIPGGSAISIALPSLAGIPAAIKLTSTVPVAASMMVSGGTQGSPGAFTAAVPAIQEQGVVADNLGGGGESSSLVLSAPGHAARVRLSEVAEGTTQAGTGQAGTGSAPGTSTQVVTVSARHSMVVQLTAPSHRHGRFAVVITPLAGSGPVYAGRVLASSGAGGVIQEILPVVSALTMVPLPSVHSAVIIGVP